MADLELRYVFGLKSSVANPLAFLDDTEVVYPAGHSIVRLDTESKAQRLVPASITSEGITAMAISPNCRYSAYAEIVTERHPTITIHDWVNKRRRKVINHIDFGSTVIHSMSFTADGKSLVVLGGGPEWNLFYVNWEKAKVVAKYNNLTMQGSPVAQVDSSPSDPTLIAACGTNLLRMLRLLEGVLRPVIINTKRELQDYLCHAWLPEDRLLVGTSSGEILLFEGAEFRMVLPHSPGEGHPVSSLQAFTKGGSASFIAGGPHGVLRLYEKSPDPREAYKRPKRFKITGEDSDVACIALSPSDDNLVCSLANGQAYLLGLANSDLIKAEEMKFEPLVSVFPGTGASGSKAITGLDVCVRKPFVVTCGTDCTVRVWNFAAHVPNKPAGEFIPALELQKTFEEEALCVALHPCGLHVAVGFVSSVKLMNLLMDDIRPFKEFAIKGCSECRFSHGGQYLAVANSAAITVFSSYTAETVCVFRAHSDRVTSLTWSPNDRSLFSTALDGVLYRWDIVEGKAKHKHEVRDCALTCVAIPPSDTGLDAYVVGEHSADPELAPFKLVDLATSELKADVELAGAQFGCVAVSPSGRLLVTGSSDPARIGVVRSYRAPLTGEFHDFVAHSAPVTRMAITHDETLIVTASVDGSISFFQTPFNAKAAPSSKRGDKDVGLEYAEEILVTKSDLEESSVATAELKAKVAELTLHNNYQLRLKDLNYAEKIKEVEEKFQEELSADKFKYDKLAQAKTSMEMAYDDKILNLDTANAKELEELEATYKAKIAAEVERYDNLIAERDHMNEEWDRKNVEMIKSHESHLGTIMEEHEAAMTSEMDATEALRTEKASLEADIRRKTSALEDDADQELDEARQKYETRLAAESKATLLLKGENGIMRKKFLQLNKDITDQKEEIRALVEKEKEMLEVVRGLEKDIVGHKKEIREREDTVADKEKRIYDLRKKNQELEKFKFVLNYKIQELKRQIMPRKKEIQDMREQIKEMELELLQYHKSNAALDLMIGELRLKKEGMQKEVDGLDESVSAAEASLRAVQFDLHATMQSANNPKALASAVSGLYRRYVHGVGMKAGEAPSSGGGGGGGESGGGSGDASEADMQREYGRQREYLEKSLEGLKRKIAKDSAMHRSDRSRLMRENTMLTSEINAIRRELRMLQQETVCIEMGISPDLITLPAQPASARTARSAAPARTMSLGGTIVSSPRSSEPDGGKTGRTTRRSGGGGTTGRSTLRLMGPTDGTAREADIQRAALTQLRERLAKLRDAVSAHPGLGRGVAEGHALALTDADIGDFAPDRRPESRGSLPPLERRPASPVL